MPRKTALLFAALVGWITAGAVAGSSARAQTPDPGAPASAFDQEQRMGFAARMHRWDPLIGEASRRFGVPEKWIRIVMQVESGGHTMLGEKQPIVSRAGAMGLMQLMPSTWQDMRAELRLGADPFTPRDNVLAGAAYLRWLKDKYGYPAMFAAYNDGPGHLEMRLRDAGLLPAETRTYVARVTAAIEGRAFIGGFADAHAKPVKFTKPNGLTVWIKPAEVISIRASFPDEYAPGVKSVIAFGRVRQGVCESLADVKTKLHLRGGAV